MDTKDASYALMVMLGTIRDEMASGEFEPVTIEEINGLYSLASLINEEYENQ